MRLIYLAITLLATSLLTACGGGGGSGGASAPASTGLSGTGSKGILQDAKVTAYALSSGVKGASLGNTRTSSDGTYTLSLAGYSGPILLELTADSLTRMLCDAPSGCGSDPFGAQITLPAGFILRSSLPQGGGNVSAAITPFTDLATQLAQSRSGGLSAANIGATMSQVADLFDLPPLTATQPMNLNGTGGTSNADEQRYAVLNAAIAELAGDPAQIANVINDLAAQLLLNNGQLINDSPNPAVLTDLATVLDAASRVSSSAAVSSKIDSLVSVIISESITTAIAAGNTITTATGSTGDSTGLAAVKAFVNQAHDLVQSILQADNETVTAEIDAKLATVTLLESEPTRAVGRLGDALCISHSLMLKMARDVEIDGSTQTTINADQANAMIASLECSAYEHMGVTFKPGFTATLNSSLRTVSISGIIDITRFTIGESCPTPDACYWGIVETAPVPVTATNLRLTYPAMNSAASQFAFGVGNSGSLETPSVKLDLSGGTGSVLTATYDASSSLASHLQALEDADGSNDAAHTPDKLQLTLKSARLTAKAAPTSEFSDFVGALSLTLLQKEFTVSSRVGTELHPAPALLSVAGTFSSGSGERLDASVSIDLDDDLESQAVLTPQEGSIRPGIFSLSHDPVQGIATFAPAEGYQFQSNGWGSGLTDTVDVRLLPADGSSCRYLEITGKLSGAISYGPWLSWFCHDSSQTLGGALAYELSLGRFSGGFQWNLAVDVPGEGVYLPSVSSLVVGPIAGNLVSARQNILQDPAHFARGAFSATMKVKLGGSAGLDSEVSISGHRTSWRGGDIAMVIKNNGKWLRTTASGTDLRTASNMTLTNQDGATLKLSPINLDDGDPDNDTFDLKLNGSNYGKLYQISGAWVARFSDNSFTLL